MSCTLLNTHIPLNAILLHFLLIIWLILTSITFTNFQKFPVNLIVLIFTNIVFLLIFFSYDNFINKEMKKLSKYEKMVAKNIQTSARLLFFVILLISLYICFLMLKTRSKTSN